MKCNRKFGLVPLLLFGLAVGLQAQTAGPAIRVAILNFGETNAGRLTAEKLASALASDSAISITDRDLARSAAHGVGYAGSLNLTLSEAQDLGAAIGCDFFLIGDAQTLRRSPSTGPAYFESYASVFLVSARSGRLIAWERPSFEGATPLEAERHLFSEISNPETSRRYLLMLRRAQENERSQREIGVEKNTPVIEEATGDVSEIAGLRLPRPYRRLRPAYPDTAARADAEGTVDVLVDLDRQGEVTRTEIARWAGFGLDEASVNTARQLHFFPALREGVPIPIRILLRYNFRKSAK